jgi:ABC-2 type transport system ATP-binding protein
MTQIPPPAALDVAGLRKVYHARAVVDGVSFRVGAGEIVGLVGLNGAGKTTIINMILGVVGPSGGTIRIGGIDLAAHRRQALERTNFSAVYAPLPGNLTVRQNLRIFGMIYEVRNLTRRIGEVVEQFDLVRFLDVRCGLLSSGEQTRVSLAKAMLNRPGLLLLDEPTASIDPSTAATIREHIRGFASREQGAVLWTSHNMYEVEEVCDRMLLLSKGTILVEGDPRRLPHEHGKATLEELFIEIAREAPQVAEGRPA